MESELLALYTTCSEAEWLKDLLSEFSIVPKPILYFQSQCILIQDRPLRFLKQDNANKKMNRHIQIRLKSVQRLLGKVVLLNFIKSEKNIADPLTKGLCKSVVLKSSREIGLSS